MAGMFTSAGFFAGHDDDVLPATPSNARGHHENLGVLQTNERVLEELGGPVVQRSATRGSAGRGGPNRSAPAR